MKQLSVVLGLGSASYNIVENLQGVVAQMKLGHHGTTEPTHNHTIVLAMLMF
jgi:hypothetical protein